MGTVLLTLLAGALLVCFPAESGDAAREALGICLETVLPALFPFFVLSSLLVGSGAPRLLARRLSRFMHPLFGVSGTGASALLLGLLGGYPSGARTVTELYAHGEVSREEAEQLLCFCNNTGPAFFLGVCAGMLGSARAGAYLYLVHVLSALLTGILLRCPLPPRGARNASAKPSPSFVAALPAAVQSALAASLGVCAYVVLFMVLLRLVFLLPPLRGLSPMARAALRGFVEMTNGITALPPTRAGFILCAAIMNWGGLSVQAQSLALCAPAGLSLRREVCGKLTQTLLGIPLALLAAGRVF